MTGGQHRHGLRLWSGHSGDGDIALGLSGAHSAADQAEAERVSHDACIRHAGRLRAGPVQWLVWDYHRDGLAVLRELGIAMSDELHTFLRQSETSVLVIAMALTDRARPGRRNR